METLKKLFSEPTGADYKKAGFQVLLVIAAIALTIGLGEILRLF